MEPDEEMTRAAEYALGLLEGEERRRFERALDGDDGLRADLAFWQERFAPLVAATPPVTPPRDVFRRIEGEIFGTRARTRWPQIGMLGMSGSMVATIVAAKVALIVTLILYLF